MSGKTPPEPVTVLIHEWVTGGGLAGSPLFKSWEAEGHAMRRAIARDFVNIAGVRVIMTLDERFPEEPGPWKIVRVGAGSGEPPMMTKLGSETARLAATVDCTVLIAPELGGLHAGLAEQAERVGAQLIGSSSKAIDQAGHKLWLAEHLAKRGIAAPESRLVMPVDGLPESATYPAVLKPVTGAGSVQTYLVSNHQDCPREVREMPNALLQTYIPGTPMSASFLVARDGRARLVGVGWQRMELKKGRFAYCGGRLPAPRAWGEGDPLRAVESIPGLRGFVGVDFIWDEQARRATVLEINPRPTTSYAGLAHLLSPGLLANAWLSASLGTPETVDRLGLATRIAAQPPITFSANGTIEKEEKGPS